MPDRERNGLEIAVIGLAGRFPGARTYRRLWENLEHGVEARTEFTDDELKAAGVSPELLADPNYVKAGPVLEGFDRFDADFFGMTPREAELADPQQRLFLECAWEAIEDAAWDPRTRAGRAGVFASSSFNRYLVDLLASGDRGGAELTAALLGGSRDFLATRLAYKLNLDGLSLTVQTACSSSLVGVYLACQALLSGSCDMAVVGGASITVPQRIGYLYQPDSILSPDARCRAFDDAANGSVRGSGVGVVILRRLEDALADGDPLRAVILGSAVNNDGSAKVGFTAPSVRGQERVLRDALNLSEVSPASIGYIEAHGTGTALGDPIEAEALNRVLADDGKRREPCRIGSVKTNIGHLDATAGVAGLIKAVLALEHGRIPASLHFRNPNRRIDFSRVPLEVPRETLEWRPASGLRRAGVSSFGIGGTNAHVVLEEPPPTSSDPAPHGWQALLLSARTEKALQGAADRLADHLERRPVALSEVASTLARGRRAFPHRRSVVARDLPGAVAALRRPADRRDRGISSDNDGEIVFLLPGQGTRLVGRGRDLYDAEPTFREALDRCAEIARPRIGEDLRRLLHPKEHGCEVAREALADTRLAQPALFALEHALAEMWRSWGIVPAALIGHSLGEWVAACQAEVFSLEDALELVVERGRLMAQAPAGAMTAVSLDPSTVESRLTGTLALAASNGPDQSVISGAAEELAVLEAELTREGVRCTRLPVDHAFHSSFVDSLVPEFVAEVRKRSAQAPRIPVLSSVTGRPLSAEDATRPEYWGEHMRRTVRFAEGLGWLLAQTYRFFVEVGPGHVLTGLVRRRAPDATLVPSLPDEPGDEAEPARARRSLGRLWVAGAAVDRRRWGEGWAQRRIPLPTYAFDHRRYLIDPAKTAPSEAGTPREAASTVSELSTPVFRREELPARSVSDSIPAGESWCLVGEHPLVAPLAARLQGSCSTASSEDEAVARWETLEASDLPLRIIHFPQDVRSLLTLVRPLFRLASDRQVHLTLVGRGLCCVLGDDASPEGAALAGFALGIPRELPGLSCGLIDLGRCGDPLTPSNDLVARLTAELKSSGFFPSSTVAYRGRYRWVREDRPIILDPGGDSGNPSRDGVATRSLPPLDLEMRERLEWREEKIAEEVAVRSLDDLPGFEAEATRLCAAYALDYLDSGDLALVPGQGVPEEELLDGLSILPKFHKLFDYLLELLVSRGWATRDAGVVTPSVSQKSVDASELFRMMCERFPEFRRILSLLDHCVRAYPAALTGEIEAISVLYPEGEFDFLQEHLEDLADFRREKIYLRLLGAALSDLAPLHSGPLRILEVGAGNGLLTEKVSTVLRNRRVRYCFTDLGQGFVQRASRRRSDFSFDHMDFRVLDISKDPISQGLSPGGYDVVLAYNVVHATPHADTSLRHLQTTLAPGGILCLLETVRSHPWLDMIFGLAEGWWYFDDPFRTHSALMSSALWKERLAKLDFAPVWSFPPPSGADTDAALLLAQRVGSREPAAVDVPSASAESAAVVSSRTLTLPALDLVAESVEGWLEALEQAIQHWDDRRRSRAASRPGRRLTILEREAAAGAPAAGKALQSALAFYAEATADEIGETTICLEGTGGEKKLSTPEAVPPGYALVFHRDANETAPEEPAQETEAVAGDSPSPAGRSSVERAILEILRDLLGVDYVDPDDRFVELGGDSLLALQVLSRVRRDVGIELRVRDLMEDRSLSSLIARAERSRDADTADAPAFHGRLPLLPSQAWCFERPTNDPHLNTVPILLEGKERLSPKSLRQALAHLHRVHESLRVRIDDEGSRRQVIAPPSGEVAFHAVDLIRLPPSRREDAARKLASRAQRRLDLFEGPVQRSLWLGLGGAGRDRVLISTHHIAFDARSLQIFFEDLWTAYRCCEAGAPVRITPPSGSLAAWVGDLERYLDSPEAADDLRCWVEQPWEEAAEIPTDEVLGANVLGTSRDVGLEIEGELGALILRRLPRLHDVDVQEIALTALVAALGEWTGESRHMVHVVGHGREPFTGGTDVSRVIGWFSTPGHPLLLRHENDPVRSLQAVSRQVRSVSDGGRGYTALRYFSRDPAVREAIRRIPSTRVLFNYVSRFSDSLETGLPARLLREPLGDTVHPRRDRGIVLKMAAGIAGGDRLRLQLGYSSNLHRRSTMEELAQRCRDWLERLADRTEEV